MNPLHNTVRPVACLRSVDARLAALFLILAGILGGPTSLQAQTVETLVDLTNTVWRYNDTGANLGTGWRVPNYPAENSWPVGRGLFGVESSSPYPYAEPIRTPLVMVPGRTTYYLRTRFSYAGQTAGLNLQATAYLDDGAVVYLNGVEVARVRLPSGTITASTKAQLAFPEGVPSLLTIPGSRLVQGDNVLAVELHQYSDTSSDIVFGLGLEILSARAPAFVDPEEPRDRSVAQEASTTLLASATGFPAPQFQWFQNDALLSGETNDSLAIASMSGLNAGTYFCVASNSLGIVTSRTAMVTYLPDTNGPALLYALGQPGAGGVLIAFSEPPNLGDAIDNFSWEIVSLDGGVTLTIEHVAVVVSETVIRFDTAEALDPSTVYVVRALTDIRELIERGNPLRAGSEVTVATFPVPLVLMDDIQAWRYRQSSTAPDASWMARDFDDSAWAAGLSPFDAFRQPDGSSCRDYIPAVEDPVRTCLTLSNETGTAQIPTAYFRTKVHFEGDAAHSILRLNTVLNDGAVFHLNGVEFLRVGMPEGAITHDSLSTRSLGDAVSESFDIHVPNLVEGENVLAVELHQGNLRSENFTFGLDLFGVLPTKPVVRSRMIIRMRGHLAEIIWSPAGGTLESSDDLETGWAPVTDPVPGHDRLLTTASELRRFYRVVSTQ